MDAATYKDAVFGAQAQVGKALSNGRRLELLDVLMQGPRTVEELARAVRQTVGNTSQHLQVLRRAAMVGVQVRGNHRSYEILPGVGALVRALRSLAVARLPEVQSIQREMRQATGELERLTLEQLDARVADGDVVLIDARPADEYAQGHLPGAHSTPPGLEAEWIDTLPNGKFVVAYCRGPFCLYAVNTARILRDQGWSVAVLESDVGDWRDQGRAVEVSNG